MINSWLDGDLSAGLHDSVLLATLALRQSGDMVITSKAELLALTQGSSPLTSSVSSTTDSLRPGE